MKRNLLIGVVLLAVLLLFTGCDQVLEIFYPEIVDNNAGYGNYRIKLNGQVDGSLTWYADWINQSAPVRAAAIPYYETENGLIMAKDEIWVKDYIGASSGFTLEFYPLKEAQYKLIVWFDLNNNMIPDYDEPSLLAGWYPSGTWFNTVFDFTAPDTPSSIDAAVVLSEWSRAPWDILDLLNYSGTPQTDYGFRIEGPDIVNAYTSLSLGYKVFLNDPSLPIDKINWELRDSYGYLYSSNTVYGPSPFWVSFPSSVAGTQFTVKVEVVYGDAANGTRSQDYGVKAVSEVPNGMAYDLWADIVNLSYDPVWLGHEPRNFFFRVIPTNNSWFSDPSDLAFGYDYIATPDPYTYIEYGYVWNSHVGSGMDAYKAAPGQKGVQAVVDMDNNGYISAGDWVSVVKAVHLTADDWDGDSYNCYLKFDSVDFHYQE